MHAEEESLVQRLCLNASDSGDTEIQKKLDEIFLKSRPGEATVAANKEHSLNSLHSLFVTNARVTLEDNLRDLIKEGYKQDKRWADILIQLESTRGRATMVGNHEYRLNHGFIEIKLKDTNEDTRPWRMVVPDIEEAHKKILEELHIVPYAGHLGCHKTLMKLQQNFYWPDHTVEVFDFVLECEVC